LLGMVLRLAWNASGREIGPGSIPDVSADGEHGPWGQPALNPGVRRNA